MNNEQEAQEIDVRTMRPVGEENSNYLQEYEKEQKNLKKELERKRNEDIKKVENPYVKIIKTLAWLILIIGIIGSIVLAKYTTKYNGFNTFLMIEGWIISGITTILLLSFAEIIKILHDIRAKIYKK